MPIMLGEELVRQVFIEAWQRVPGETHGVEVAALLARCCRGVAAGES